MSQGMVILLNSKSEYIFSIVSQKMTPYVKIYATFLIMMYLHLKMAIGLARIIDQDLENQIYSSEP